MKPKNARRYLLEDFRKSNYFIDLFSLLFPGSLLTFVDFSFQGDTEM